MVAKPSTTLTLSTQSVSFTLPADTFAHTRADAVVTLAATQASGAALPGWLSFNPQTGTFVGTVPPGLTGEVVVRIIARDQDGREAVTLVRIGLGGGRVQPGQSEGTSEPGSSESQRPQDRENQSSVGDDIADPVFPLAESSIPSGKPQAVGKAALVAQFQKFGIAGRQASSADLLLMARKAAANQVATVPRA